MKFSKVELIHVAAHFSQHQVHSCLQIAVAHHQSLNALCLVTQSHILHLSQLLLEARNHFDVASVLSASVFLHALFFFKRISFRNWFSFSRGSNRIFTFRRAVRCSAISKENLKAIIY